MKKLARIFIPFLIFFIIGISSEHFFVSTEKPSNKQTSSKNENKILSSVAPKLSECFNPLDNLNQQAVEISNWLRENKEASEKEKLIQLKKLNEIMNQMQSFRDLEKSIKKEPRDEGIGNDLVIRQKCY